MPRTSESFGLIKNRVNREELVAYEFYRVRAVARKRRQTYGDLIDYAGKIAKGNVIPNSIVSDVTQTLISPESKGLWRYLEVLYRQKERDFATAGEEFRKWLIELQFGELLRLMVVGGVITSTGVLLNLDPENLARLNPEDKKYVRSADEDILRANNIRSGSYLYLLGPEWLLDPNLPRNTLLQACAAWTMNNLIGPRENDLINSGKVGVSVVDNALVDVIHSSVIGLMATSFEINTTTIITYPSDRK